MVLDEMLCTFGNRVVGGFNSKSWVPLEDTEDRIVKLAAVISNVVAHEEVILVILA